MKEYILTCRSYEDLEDLYNDMETPGGSLYIPDRAVELVHRRTISRNTHYMLTEEEAVEIRNDPRVLGCEITFKDSEIIKVGYDWTQTADFNKTTGTFSGDDKNWGLYRTVKGETLYDSAATYDITVTASGSSNYTLSGNDRNGSVSGSDPTVTFNVGDTMKFAVNASGHPFYIRVSNGGSNVSTPAATGQGSTNGTVTWTPNTAGTYYYQCGFHSSMIGTITVNEVSSSWGSNDTSEITNKNIVTTASGKNVDVVIVDGHVNPDHPEFAVNPDGTGGSRVNQFNWFQYNSALGYGSNGTYTYSTSGASPNTNHGTHVAGTVAGNTQGWARDANIYNMAFSDSLSGVTSWSEKLWDYLRHFHKNKPINSETGRRNPTVTNHSWGSSYITLYLTDTGTHVDSVNYRGTTTTMTGTESERKALLEARGVPCRLGNFVYKLPSASTALSADIEDAINDGVIVISSAGNSAFNADISTGLDYNNTLTFTHSGFSYTVYTNRGGSPGFCPGVICVGSVGSKKEEYKSDFSNWGARVDIWASGSDIISAVYDSSSATTESSGGYTPIIADSRNSSYHLASISGTSMSSPQVCGVIACLAEQEQNITQAEALQYLKETSTSNVGDQGGNPHASPYEGFGSTSNNRYLFDKKKRPTSGTLSPAVLHKNRNPDSSGVKYPRVRNNRVFK